MVSRCSRGKGVKKQSSTCKRPDNLVIILMRREKETTMQDSISKVLLSATLLGLSVATVQADCQPASSQACINIKNAEEAYKREQKENEKKRMDEYAKRAGNNANH